MPDTLEAMVNTAVHDAPAQIAALLDAYRFELANIDGQSRLPMSFSDTELSAAEAAIDAEVAALRQRTVEDLQRLEAATALALAEARIRLEATILPAMSSDPQVRRVFELRQTRALARLRAVLDRARTSKAADEAVRQFANAAARSADWAALRVLRTETGPYLRRRGIDPATSDALDIVDRTVAATRPRSAGPLAERQALESGAVQAAEAFAQALSAVDGQLGAARSDGRQGDADGEGTPSRADETQTNGPSERQPLID